MAYNPITRSSRKEYLANNLWFEVFKRIDEETLIMYKKKKESGEDAEKYLDKLPEDYKAKFIPGYTIVQRSTLQQRKWETGATGGGHLKWEGNEPYIYILVSGKERFKYTEQEIPQDYALVITFTYDSQEDIKLYNILQNNVKIKQTQRTRIRTRV